MSSILTPKKNELGWKANLQLEFTRPPDQQQPCILSKKRFSGPLTVQKPFYPEGDVCHVYVLHPPGGVVGGDQLRIDLKLKRDAHALLTTPAATKFYRSENHYAVVEQNFEIADKACLEWLPQENILFDAAQVHSRSRVHLHSNAKLIAWDITCLGRPACGEKFERGFMRQRFEIFIDQQRCLTDHMIIQGGDESLMADWGLRGFPVFGYMLLYAGTDGDMQQLIEKLRPLVAINAEENLSVCLINNIIVCRYLGYHGECARNKLTQLWEIARPHMLNKSLHVPRIWLT